ncbi:hypothetical protein BD560DRAFT_105445 [Blakeslea trispora]|nr:hypothetical protein BD560DRAFT_105445 [Blakeslea trispora]
MNSLVSHFLQNYLSQHQANNANSQNSLLGNGPTDWLTNAATFAGVDALLNRYDEENEDKNHFWRNAGLAGALALGYQYFRDHYNRPQQPVPMDNGQQQMIAQQGQPVNETQPYAPYYYPSQPIDYNQSLAYSNAMMPSQPPFYGPFMMPPLLPYSTMNSMGYSMPVIPQDPYMTMVPNQMMQQQQQLIQLQLQQQQQQYGAIPFQNYGVSPYAYNQNMVQMPMTPYSVQHRHIFGHHRPAYF